MTFKFCKKCAQMQMFKNDACIFCDPFSSSNGRSGWRIVKIASDRIFIQGTRNIDAEHIWYEIQKQYPNRRLIYKNDMRNWHEIVSVNGYVKFKLYSEDTPF